MTNLTDYDYEKRGKCRERKRGLQVVPFTLGLISRQLSTVHVRVGRLCSTALVSAHAL